MPETVVVHPAVVLAEGEQRLALAQERAAAQAGVPQDQRAERRGRGRLARGQGGAEPHADRRHVGRAEVEEELAGRLHARQPGRDPVRVVLEPGGVTGAVVVEAQRDDAVVRERLGEPAERAVGRPALLPHRRAQDRPAAHQTTCGRRDPAVERSLLRAEPHLGVDGPVGRDGSGHRTCRAERTSPGQPATSIPWVANRASVIRSRP